MHDLLDTPHITEDLTWNKLRWLKSTVHKNITKHKDKLMYEPCMGMMLYIEKLQNKLEKGKPLTEKDLIECNNILKLIKERYDLEIDWRDDIQKDFEHLII